MAEVVEGIADGCRQSGCALLGGETAEMPGFYPKGRYDLAGFCVAVVEEDELIDGQRIQPGDSVIGVASSGVHSNGFSLVRKVLEKAKAFMTKSIFYLEHSQSQWLLLVHSSVQKNTLLNSCVII